MSAGEVLVAAAVPAEWGQYRVRAEVLGVQVKAYDCVCPEAVEVACHVLRQMLRCTPKPVMDRLAAAATAVAIIGEKQGRGGARLAMWPTE